MKRQSQPWIIRFVALVTAANGLVILGSFLGREAAWVQRWRQIFPIEFVHLSGFLSLILGFSLVISSFNLYRRKRRAFVSVLSIALITCFVDLARGDYRSFLYALVLVLILVATRKGFTVRSNIPDARAATLRLLTGLCLAVVYGVAGFWLLDPRAFGIDFTLGDSIRRTVGLMTVSRGWDLTPHTVYARWFLDSLSLITVVAVLYAGLAIFHPVIYRLRTQPRERLRARKILDQHGRCALDYFKMWPDKSFFFSASGRSFIAYAVAGNFALALGDPIGPPEELEELISAFLTWCNDNDWRLAFYQTLPDLLPLYRRLGLKELKIGEDATVHLETFTLSGSHRKGLRNVVRRLESQDVRVVYHQAPLSEDVIALAREVSDDWLALPGRRERTFTLGQFDEQYIRSTSLMAVHDAEGKMLAFVNVVPSYRKGEATCDLMRRHRDAPNGVMDYLLVKLIEWNKEQGHERFNLGMAPMSGFHERESATIEETLIHNFFQRLNFLFSYSGLKHYKAKFADEWEPRYVVFRRLVDLPSLVMALNRVSRVPAKRALGGRSRTRSWLWSRLRALPRFAFTYVIAAVCLIWVFHDTSFREVYQSVPTLRWQLLSAAVFLDIAGYAFQALRWQVLLRPFGPPPLILLGQAIYGGLFVNEVMPMRVGEAVRAYMVSRRIAVGVLSILPSMAVERLLDGIVLSGAMALTAFFVPLPARLAHAAELLALIVVVLMMLFVWLVVTGTRSPAEDVARRHEGSLTGKIRKTIRELRGEIRKIGQGGQMIRALFYSVMLLAAQAAAFWLIIRATDLQLSLWAGAAVMIIVHLGTAIPNAPANVGTYQFFCVLGLSLFGVDKPLATALSVLIFVVLTVPLWLLGWLAIHKSNFRLARAVQG